MTFFKENIFIAFVLSGVILLSGTTFAYYSSTAAYQEIDTTSTNVAALSFRVQGIASSTVNTFVDQIWKLKFKAAIGNRFQFGLYWNGGTNGSFLDFLNDTTIISSSSQPAGYEPTSLTKDGNFYTIAYPSFQPTGDVYIQFRSLVASTDIYGTDTNNYDEGEFCDGGNNPYTNPCNDGGLADAYFVFSESGELPPADSIEITYPENESTPFYDFSNWIVEFTTATSTTATSTDYYIKEVYVGSTTSTIENLSGGASFGESPLDVPNNLIFNPNYTYYAQARLIYYVTPNFNLVATSSIISFTPSSETETGIGEGLYPMPISTSTIEFWSITCDPESGFFQNSLCNLARFLFVPTQLSVTNLINLKDDIADKPPFGYFGLIKDALSDLSATGTPAFTLVGVEALEIDFLDKIKDAIKIILYLVFGFWLLRRVINFDFHT